MMHTDTVLKNFIELSETEQLLVLEWRNNINVRKWMHNFDIIHVEEHLKFIDFLKKSNDRQYFLVINNGKEIGVIYLTNINQDIKSSEFGLYANPTLKGFGDRLMLMIKDYVFNKMKFNKLIAEVYFNNKKAIELYKRHNFMEVKRVLSNKKEVVYMELIHETR